MYRRIRTTNWLVVAAVILCLVAVDAFLGMVGWR
jgi:hypothetical protein